MTPCRYRVALWACPGTYRHERGSEILATLEDGDRDRGRPALREAAGLVLHGVSLRLAAPYATPLLAVLGVLALVAAVAPEGWWGHHPVPTSPPSEGGFGPNPPIVRMSLAATGLVAIGTARPRTAVVLAAITPYALLVSSDLQMAYGSQSFSVRAHEALPLAGISVVVLASLAATTRTLRRSTGAAATIAAALAGASAAALLATIQASTRPWGSGGPGYPLGPNVVSDFGLPTLACAAVLICSSAVAVRALPRRTATAA